MGTPSVRSSIQGPTRHCRKSTVYKEMYKTDLEKNVVLDTSADFHKLMVALAKGRRAKDGAVTDYELIDPRYPGS